MTKILEGTAAIISGVGNFIAMMVIFVYSFTVCAPYLIEVPPGSIELIDRSKGTVDTITVLVAGFFFGSSYQRRAASKPSS